MLVHFALVVFGDGVSQAVCLGWLQTEISLSQLPR
jgi:hypothetical protein